MRKRLLAPAILAVALALAIAGCGGDDSSSSSGGYGGRGSAATANETASANGAAVVSAATTPKLGMIVVDSGGFTLYDFHKDKGGKPSCYGACAQVWPPVTTDGEPKAEGGAEASKLGTVKRSDGTVQVTYAGHPLYTYTADEKPGEARGNDIDAFGAEWYALQPSGVDAQG